MKNNNNPHRYDDMLDMPHHVSMNHPQMSLRDRAAQFSPFAALTGYDDAIIETARLTDQRIELSDSDKALLDQKLHILMDHISERPFIEISYFLPDQKKKGGKYTTISGNIKRVDEYKHCIFLTDGQRIPIDEIIHFGGEVFSKLDNLWNDKT